MCSNPLWILVPATILLLLRLLHVFVDKATMGTVKPLDYVLFVFIVTALIAVNVVSLLLISTC